MINKQKIRKMSIKSNLVKVVENGNVAVSMNTVLVYIVKAVV